MKIYLMSAFFCLISTAAFAGIGYNFTVKSVQCIHAEIDTEKSPFSVDDKIDSWVLYSTWLSEKDRGVNLSYLIDGKRILAQDFFSGEPTEATMSINSPGSESKNDFACGKNDVLVIQFVRL